MSVRVRSVLALGFALSGCPSASPEKSEAAAVSRAVTALRDADNEKKRDLLGALRQTSCSTEDVCSVRSACLAAYELHVETLVRTEEATAPAGSARMSAAALDELAKDLARARTLTGSCADAQGAMIRHYKL